VEEGRRVAAIHPTQGLRMGGAHREQHRHGSNLRHLSLAPSTLLVDGLLAHRKLIHNTCSTAAAGSVKANRGPTGSTKTRIATDDGHSKGDPYERAPARAP
jgi:hypothetical protein